MGAALRETLATYFRGVGAKILARVEVDQERSNQHELNGAHVLVDFLGREPRNRIPTLLLYLADDTDEVVTDHAELSWYDSRRDQPHRAAEFRLYYPSNAVMEAAQPGDIAVVAERADGSLLVVVAPDGSTSAQQLRWLFDVYPKPHTRTYTRTFDEPTELPTLGFGARTLLDALGIELREDHPDAGALVERYGDTFPTTRAFSRFARETCGPEVHPVDDPDAAMLAWLEWEEALFRALERKVVSEQIERGFDDVDHFIAFSLSVQNRRKSRVGYALENHLEEIFGAHRIRYTRGGVTEHPAKPDFVFPSIDSYHDRSFPSARLSMLGVKSSCKDRWRQVLSEARRVERKHLFTIEPGISENQTGEMQANELQLVVPAGLHETYSGPQQGWLFRLSDFLNVVSERERKMSSSS